MKKPVIWKAKLLPGRDGRYPVEMPEGAEILSVAAQNDDPVVWFRCDPSKPIKARELFVVGTGNPGECPTAEEARFIGTAMMYAGKLVLHVFEPV